MPRHTARPLVPLLVGLTVLLAACGTQDDTPRPPVDPVPILLDGAEVAQARTEDFDARRPLTELLEGAAKDPTTWRVLEVRSNDGRFMRVVAPAEKRARQQVVVYREDSGDVSIGFFRPPAPDAPAHVQEALARAALRLVKPARIEIRTQEPKPAAPKPFDLTIKVQGGKTTRIGTAELATLAAPSTEPEPKMGGAGRRAAAGWLLSDVLGLATDVAALARVDVHGEGEKPTPIDAAALAGEGGRVVRIKQNRRGVAVVSVWQMGGAKPKRVLQVREVRKLVAIPR